MHPSKFLAQSILQSLSQLFLSQNTKAKSERIILIIAVVSYLIHLGIILFSNQQAIPSEHNLLNNPISAIYTPFSFILIYEVYLLIFYLPQSTSFYIAKQYEIITLIVIRRIFKDIGNIKLQTGWFQNQYDLQFTYDTLTSLVLFLLIFLFYKSIKTFNKNYSSPQLIDKAHTSFVYIKKCIAIILVPVLFSLAIISFFQWFIEATANNNSVLPALNNVNNVFFDDFFNILIVVDVLLLLMSFFYSDKFHTIIRNSGFVISTIMIKVSFSVSGVVNNLLIVGAIVFGLGILCIYNLFENLNNKRKLES